MRQTGATTCEACRKKKADEIPPVGYPPTATALVHPAAVMVLPHKKVVATRSEVEPLDAAPTADATKLELDFKTQPLLYNTAFATVSVELPPLLDEASPTVLPAAAAWPPLAAAVFVSDEFPAKSVVLYAESVEPLLLDDEASPTVLPAAAE